LILFFLVAKSKVKEDSMNKTQKLEQNTFGSFIM